MYVLRLNFLILNGISKQNRGSKKKPENKPKANHINENQENEIRERGSKRSRGGEDIFSEKQ